MERLRIKLRGKGLDPIGAESERPDFTPLPDLHVLEEPHQPISSATPCERRPTRIGDIISHRTCPAELRTTALKVTIPVSGLLLERRASVTSTSSIKSSPGRSGASQ